MKTNRLISALGLSVVLTLVCEVGEARRRADDDGFPDYNKLEFAKPLPPPDQQTPQIKPGAIQLRVGRESVEENVPIHAVPIPILRKQTADDESEPPMTGMMDDPAAPAAPATPAAPKKD